ncbi:MAG TPA: (2Fe-2S) ferredoxin domain-containing protein [Thermotogota bacterium]|nr:(2Fe-2S) ferredoxin domain-containing protein [Thermotogota bacterium]HRW91385.1 (2Fe-2S) ferredoxin domain-containing protein [Thermotogota bacterium]
MAKVKSLEELMKIKEQTVKGMSLRDSSKKGKLLVAMGTCGIAAGAKDTYQALVSELADKNIQDFAVLQSGCMGLCDVEPTVKVEIESQEPIVYGHVTPAQVKRIVQQHLVEGKVVSDLLIKKGEL